MRRLLSREPYDFVLKSSTILIEVIFSRRFRCNSPALKQILNEVHEDIHHTTQILTLSHQFPSSFPTSCFTALHTHHYIFFPQCDNELSGNEAQTYRGRSTTSRYINLCHVRSSVITQTVFTALKRLLMW